MINFAAENTSIMIDIVFEKLKYRLNETKKTASLQGSEGLWGARTNYNYNSPKKETDIIVSIPDKVPFDGNNYVVTEIASSAFDSATGLEELYIPASVEFAEWAFYDCRQLRAIHVAEANPFFCDKDGVLFSKQKRELLAYPNQHGEEYCIPEGTTIISGKAFKSCRALKKVAIPSSVIQMGNNVFYDCGELDIYLPDDFKILQVYTKISAPFHYNKLRFHLCGVVYSKDALNDHLRKQYNLK